MELQDIIKKLNGKIQTSDFDETLCDEISEDVFAKEVDRSNPDNHRWYAVSDIVYEITENKRVLGFVKVAEVTKMFSEMNGLEDIHHSWKIVEVFPKTVSTTIYLEKE